MRQLPLSDRQLYLLAGWAILLTYNLLVGRASQLIPTAGLIVLILFLLLLALGGWLLWQSGQKIAATSIDMGLLVLGASIVLSAIASIDPSRSWRMAWVWLACIVTFYMAVMIFRSGGSVERFSATLLSVLVIFVAFAYQERLAWYFDWSAAFGDVRAPADLQPRVLGLTGSPNILGAMINVGLMVCIGYLWEYGRRAWPAALWIVGAIPVYFFANSRSALIGTMAGLTVFALGYVLRITNGRVSSRMWLRLIGGLAAGTIFLLAIFLFFRPDALRLAADRSFAQRLDFWAAAINTWQNNPIFGSGLDTHSTFNMLRNRPIPSFPYRAAHSLWFSFLGSAGTVGVLAVLFLWWQFAQMIWRSLDMQRWTPFAIGWAAALATLCVHASFDTPESWIIWISALALAAIVALVDVPPTQLMTARWPLGGVWTMIGVALLLVGFLSHPYNQAYSNGVSAAKEGDWEAAANSFDVAIDRPFFEDSASLLASGLAYGVLAADNSAHIGPAQDRFERLILLEPGWPTNYANLAALQWQAGEQSAALDTIDQAIELSPRNPLYALNRLLWLESMGGTDGEGERRRQLYELERSWHGASLWQNERDPYIDPDLSVGWAQLTDGDLLLAEETFTAELAADPFSVADPYIGLGVVRLMQGQTAEAELLFRQGNLVQPGLQPQLWQNWIEMADDPVDEQAERNLNWLGSHTTFGIGSGGTTVYTTSILGRSDVSIDLLPQLMCFRATDWLDRQTVLLQQWHSERGTPAAADWVSVLRGEGQSGLTSCTPIRSIN